MITEQRATEDQVAQEQEDQKRATPGPGWLVVGDDRGEASAALWGWVAAQPWPGWRVTAVTARPRTDESPGERAKPHAWSPEPPRELPDNHVEHLVAEADPRVVLDGYDDADLVVVGPRGRGLLKRLGLGSTAEWLVSSHRPLTPVLVARGTEPVEHVMVCADGSPDSVDAVRTLARLPLLQGARVTVVGVDTVEGHETDAVTAAAHVLRDAGAGEVRTLLVGAVPMTVTFDVRPTILGMVDKLEPDLVVVGTRGLGGLRRAVLGSTAEAVVHHATCSVLVGRATLRS